MAIKEDVEDRTQKGIREPLVVGEQNHHANKGHPWMVYFSTFIAVCGSYEFGACAGYSSPTQDAIRKDLSLSLAEYSLFGSILTFGAMVGAITSGPLADFIGRKGAMRVSSAFCVAGWLVIYFSEGPVPLDIGRLATGYGMGVFSYVVPVFVAEIAPKELRGALTTLNQFMIVTAVSVSFIIGNVLSWRALAIIGLVPTAVLLLGLFFIPESPRWLAKRGHKKDFVAALQILRGKDADISEEAEEIQIGIGLMVCQQFGGINGICFYASSIFEQAGFSPTIGTITYACLQLSGSGLVAGCIFAAVAFYLKVHEVGVEAVPALAVTGILVYIGSFSIGMGAIPWVVMSEIFPVNVKGLAGSVATLTNWFGAWLCSYTFNFLMSWSSYGTFILYAAINALAILFIIVAVPETKVNMAIKDDVEEGMQKGVREPLVAYASKGHPWMVYFTTFVAVCVWIFISDSRCYQEGFQSVFGRVLIVWILLTFGAMVGAITSGPIADFIGRKGAMRVSSAFCVAGWLGPVPLDIGRLATGYGMGVFSYLFVITAAVSVSFTIGNVLSWRALAIIGLIPTVVLLLGLFFIPESPRWLAKRGRQKDFVAALQILRGKDADISEEAEEIQDYITTLERLPKSRLLELFHRRYLRSVTIGIGLMVCQQFGGINGICFYTSSIFELAGFSPTIGTITYACLQIVTTGLGAALIDKAGRKPLLLISGSGLVVGCMFAAVAFYLKVHEVGVAAVPALAVMGILIFPVNIKGLAGSVATLVNWFGACLCSYTFNFFMSWSSYGTFILYAAINALAILFIIVAVPETKGKSLEQLQADINS
ncbi:Sugar transporter ERD6-like 7 [Glycine max]|nr:Sugar transporter ERD6-like 7 [Glycine max]